MTRKQLANSRTGQVSWLVASWPIAFSGCNRAPNGLLSRPVNGELQLRDSSRFSRESLLASRLQGGTSATKQFQSPHTTLVAAMAALSCCVAKIQLLCETDEKKFRRPMRLFLWRQSKLATGVSVFSDCVEKDRATGCQFFPTASKKTEPR